MSIKLTQSQLIYAHSKIPKQFTISFVCVDSRATKTVHECFFGPSVSVICWKLCTHRLSFTFDEFQPLTNI